MKRFFFCFILLAASAATLAQSPVQPLVQTSPDAAPCLATAVNPDISIKHCTAAIESGKSTGNTLAQLYTSRAGEWINKGNYDRAIADADAALKIAPTVPRASYYRGVAWANRGEFNRAITDFDAAIALKSDDAMALYARAIEHSIKGDYPRAIADFDAVLRLNPKMGGVHFARGRTLFYMSDYPRATTDLEAALKAQPNAYIALWVFLARKYGGSADAEYLLERETRGIRSGWPDAVIALYGNRTNTESVVNAATDADQVRRREMRCEADFYIAHWHVLQNAQPRARSLLQQVQTACPKNLLEYEGAVAELRRLK